MVDITLYFLIFISKVIEISLGTLRLIVVSNGKKWLGAFLQLAISIVWIFSTGAVLVNVKKDPLKIFFFAFGSFVGSYIGSYMEEKLAIGSNIITCIAKQNTNLPNCIRKNGYAVTVLKGEGMEGKRDVLMILTTRKKRRSVVSLIQRSEDDCIIISETATPVIGGYEKSNIPRSS